MSIADNYPVGMSECDRNGINGSCGYECPVFLRGECEYQDEMQLSADCLDYFNTELHKLRTELITSNGLKRKLQKENEKLTEENKRLKNRFIRFDIMDFGD